MSRITLRPLDPARTLRVIAGSASLLLFASACGPGARGPEQTRPAAPAAAPARKTADEPGRDPNAERYVWQALTRSPDRAAQVNAELEPPCATPDAALTRVAERIAARELRGAPALEVAEVTFALRAEGAPYVWPRTWTLLGKTAIAEAPARLRAWSAASEDAGERRCGIATARANGLAAVAAVSVGALADLEALPTRVRVGEWLDVRARLLEPAAAAAVLVLGPRGGPSRVTSSLDSDRVRARFRADREGTWLVQVLADVSGGPRPVAEALVFAESEPNPHFAAEPVPGETARGRDDTESLAAMLAAARHGEGLGPLARDERLDRVALEHAAMMRTLGRIAHDAGDGTPGERARAAGVNATLVGENVAHARNAALAHRSLWASPSHRANLLEPNYDTVGIGVVPGEDGSVWVSEVFAKVGRAR